MKTWIIILTITYIFLRLVAKGIANYIKNDGLESLKYKVFSGASVLGIWYGFIYHLGTLVGFADIVLIIITIVKKFL